MSVWVCHVIEHVNPQARRTFTRFTWLDLSQPELASLPASCPISQGCKAVGDTIHTVEDWTADWKGDFGSLFFLPTFVWCVEGHKNYTLQTHHHARTVTYNFRSHKTAPLALVMIPAAHCLIAKAIEIFYFLWRGILTFRLVAEKRKILQHVSDENRYKSLTLCESHPITSHAHLYTPFCRPEQFRNPRHTPLSTCLNWTYKGDTVG